MNTLASGSFPLPLRSFRFFCFGFLLSLIFTISPFFASFRPLVHFRCCCVYTHFSKSNCGELFLLYNFRTISIWINQNEQKKSLTTTKNERSKDQKKRLQFVGIYRLIRSKRVIVDVFVCPIHVAACLWFFQVNQEINWTCDTRSVIKFKKRETNQRNWFITVFGAELIAEKKMLINGSISWSSDYSRKKLRCQFAATKTTRKKWKEPFM